MIYASEVEHQKRATSSTEGQFFVSGDARLVVGQVFEDFDELSSTAREWNLEFHKLDTNPCEGALFQLLSERLIIFRGSSGNHIRQAGDTPPGYRTFVVPSRVNVQMFWRSRHVHGNNLLVFPTGGELFAVSEPGFDAIAVSVLQDDLLRYAEVYECEQEIRRALRASEVLDCDSDEIGSFRRWLLSTLSSQRVVCTMPMAEALDGVLSRLIGLLSRATESSSRRPTPMRLHSVLTAEDYVLQHPEDPPSVLELCQLTGASKRTLEYAFQECFGMNPKAYINAIRLNRVRQYLRSAPAGQLKVVEAANAFGFWHMGQFAADYHKLFGERPSETLAASG